ncbi:ABC transporter ATP-binding protein [Clostridium vincentii]|uniref:sn-glycerol-3-phosphate import ATP-binding protein UgpC n=1 Tax=Clostridium vincentii TaxID=52704 RepID=A0A2T0BE96_9CLOT|nr:ABC transporter ATP-binding protein [Clostridium vincentii]PRR82163.1 sn-glycerol-3-phosphate import ATP-binding protein UgpC [Clostridium vincentii]
MKVILNNIGKKYESREEFTLRNINLEIEDKDFCVILGPSGCGKTTLLRMIAGLNSITEGDLIFGTKRVNKLASKDRDIAMVFQSYALYPHMTVYENMAFSLSMRKERKDIIQERVTETAKLLQIEDYLHCKPSDISGGQRQRVALGRAIVRKSKVFLMDEPLSNLDAKLREHMRVELVRIHKQLETTTIYVTHDQVEAMTMATKIVLMNDGKVQQVGKPYEFYNKPENMFVAKFIGSPTINMIKGKIINNKFTSDDGLINITPNEADIKALINYNNKDIYLGIRSERFISGKNAEHFESVVDIIEVLGKDKTLFVKLKSGKDLLITVPGHFNYEIGESHMFGLDSEALHFFDAETQQRIN